MVKKLLSLLGKEIGGLHEAAYLLAAATIASSLLALVRDKLLAYSFGAGSVLDLYYSSFRISDMMYATIASTVAASILVPFLIKKSKGSEKYFIDHVFSAFFVAIIGVSVVIWILMPYIIPRLLPGYAHSSDLPMLISMSRIMLLSPIFMGLSNFLASITQMYNRFLIYAISPLLYNVGIIVGTVVLYPIFGVYGLVFGVVLGAAMHMGIQLPFVASRGLVPAFRFPIDWKEIRELVLISFPRTLTVSSNFFLLPSPHLWVRVRYLSSTLHGICSQCHLVSLELVILLRHFLRSQSFMVQAISNVMCLIWQYQRSILYFGQCQ